MVKQPENKISMMLLKKRFEKNLSQRKMAEEIGVSYPVYSGIERNTYKASLKLLSKIADYLKLDLKTVINLYLK